MSRLRHTSPLLVALLALALPASALASPRQAIIKDCAADGRVDGHYKRSQLNDARKHIPTDVNEYTDCRSAIEAALAAGSSAGGGGSQAPASTNPALKTSAGAYAGSTADLAAYKAAT
ncbi:MAG: hypothetical protein QOD53_523, partial [Thermoleophilaceae bacterium]|nr:hypothetical protein [Thermoleophilaceae bacterium]